MFILPWNVGEGMSNGINPPISCKELQDHESIIFR
jgi:hypothetical protein